MENFNKLLDEYKNQYLQFLATGSAEFKTAYQRAMDGIESAITEKREQVDAEKRAMKHFAATYKKDNEELTDALNTASTMTEDAQQIHDEYEGSKNRYDVWTSGYVPQASINYDVSNGYGIMLRFGIFLILLPILILIGYLTPRGGEATRALSSAISTPPTPRFSFSPTAFQ
jgi:vacuolar-type H+-ATPase subunit I/STV1